MYFNFPYSKFAISVDLEDDEYGSNGGARVVYYPHEGELKVLLLESFDIPKVKSSNFWEYYGGRIETVANDLNQVIELMEIIHKNNNKEELQTLDKMMDEIKQCYAQTSLAEEQNNFKYLVPGKRIKIDLAAKTFDFVSIEKPAEVKINSPEEKSALAQSSLFKPEISPLPYDEMVSAVEIMKNKNPDVKPILDSLKQQNFVQAFRRACRSSDCDPFDYLLRIAEKYNLRIMFDSNSKGVCAMDLAQANPFHHTHMVTTLEYLLRSQSMRRGPG